MQPQVNLTVLRHEIRTAMDNYEDRPRESFERLCKALIKLADDTEGILSALYKR